MLKVADRLLRVARPFFDRVFEAVVDVIVYQRLLGAGDRLLDRVQLLRNLQAVSIRLQHIDGAFQVAQGALQALEDFRVGSVRSHGLIISPWIG